MTEPLTAYVDTTTIPSAAVIFVGDVPVRAYPAHEAALANDLARRIREVIEADRQRVAAPQEGIPYSPYIPCDNPLYHWKGPGPAPSSWYAPDGTKVYRSYADYCDD